MTVHILETIYHMVAIYGTLVKMITSPGIFFIFSILIHWLVGEGEGGAGGKRSKNGPK